MKPIDLDKMRPFHIEKLSKIKELIDMHNVDENPLLTEKLVNE
jgi:hypothetical protein